MGRTVLGVVVVAGLAAYAMARLDLPGGSGVVLYLLVIGSLPTQMFLVPLFYLETRSGLYDTHLGVIVIYCATLSPFATLLLRSFLVALPRELEQAARIDGANEIQTGYSQNPVLIAAAGVIMLLPMLLLFIALQRRFVDGLAATGMSS